MEIRLLGESDYDSAGRIWTHAFLQGRRADAATVARFRETAARSATIGAFEDNAVRATAMVIPFDIHLGASAVIPMGGIGLVACEPTGRGRGYAGACLDASLEQMRRAGQLVSFLFPFSWDYYRRYGWEWVGFTRRYEVPTRILRSTPETEFVRQTDHTEMAAIREVYTAFARGYRGMVARSEPHWREMLEDGAERDTYSYLYDRGEGAEGYLTYAGGGDRTQLREFIAQTPRALRGLLGLLRRHDMQIPTFQWKAPGDDTLWLTGYHWDIGTELRPTTQARIVDVAPALAAWTPAPDAHGRVRLGVDDPHAPWNQGTWSIEFDHGHVSVAATKDAPQVTLDIQALTQAYFGAPTLDDLRRAGRLEVDDDGGFQALRSLLDGPTMWINDGF